MVSKRIQKALEGNSAIRAMFNEGREMAAKYGEENVFDFSLGNPATPAPRRMQRERQVLWAFMVIWQMRATRKYARRSQRI